VAKKYDLDEEEARNWRLAKIFDLRSFIGVLFVIFGILVVIPGLTASPEDLAKSAGININLWVGLLMLALGVLFLGWLLANPPEPVTKEQMEAHRKDLEDLGTHSGLQH
jgi:hypothetical protein